MDRQAGYYIGQVIPAEPQRGIVHGPEIAPIWHALIVPPQKELAVREYLRAQGVFSFFPSENRVRVHKGRRIEREHPLVTRHVYAQFRQAPQWDVMKLRRRLIHGVFCVREEPVIIPAAIIKRLQGLTVEAEKLVMAKEELRRQRAAAMLVKPGDRAEVVSGPLGGFMVDVLEVKGGEAWFQFLTGGKGRASADSLAPIRGLEP